MKIPVLIVAGFISLCSTAQTSGSPKLVVGIVVDQMCYEYLYRFRSKFGEDGFVKLMEQGTNCRNTHYNYVPTFTGPGHASIYTGTTPANHGIVANEWYDRNTGKPINCVTDSMVGTVGSSSTYGKYSPVNLKVNTITDQLRLTYPDARVISMSIKNRGAILPGGHLSNGSYWFDYTTGTMITSSFFREQLPDWVTEFNKRKYPEKACSMTWNTHFPIGDYTESGPDDRPYEHVLPGKTAPVFPYDLKAMTGGTPNYELFTYTPFSNTFLTDFAIAALDAEGLGKDAQTDMLCISYSTPDIAGHAFGPHSVEIEDMYIRLDMEIARLLKELEARVGKKQFTLFITADHAVVPVPQFLMDQQLPGGYVFLNAHLDALRSFSAEHFGADLIETEENLNIYLKRDLIREMKLDIREVSEVLAAEIQQWEGVKRVFTAEQLYGSGINDEWTDMVRRGFHHAESGDILCMLEPGYLPKSEDSELARKGTSHGSAFNYDTHVPLLWYGCRIPAQEVFRKVYITDIAATLAHLFNVQFPSALTGGPILEILDTK